MLCYFEARPDQLPPPGTTSEVRLDVDGMPVGAVSVAAGQRAPRALPPFGERLHAGEHRVRLSADPAVGSFLPFTLAMRCHTREPHALPAEPSCKVHLEVTLTRCALVEGEGTDVAFKLRNTTQDALPMVVAILGVPAGLVAQAEALDALVATVDSLSCYELRGRDVVLYLAGLEPAAELELHFEVLAVIPGSYTGPPSRAYLYYTDEDKCWAGALHADIETDRGLEVVVA